ncbi:DUF5906 domain-containing protein [Xenorhabdus innexi]|uniref:DNA primase n=1 Tax=Xenorhabdus innexi TaxID=290109 RepID=A0A1N6MZF5_9GAMM|nr:DUF5906 domain-containing protein [Xenorhabdus innexi]PHM29053.1 DNA primase [Xenorhabdus innexi]SIP74154.1 Zinc-binding domain of primase-helicase [Xenorhabdus innexi]
MVTQIDIKLVKVAAQNQWQGLLSACGVNVPEKGKQGACPICGGTDRFHFIDDHGNGDWHCRQCDNPNHGDGFDLLVRSQGITLTEAVKAVSDALALPLPEPARKEAPKSESPPITEKVNKLVEQSIAGQSDYLTKKGLQCPDQRLLKDGSLLLVIQALDSTITGAQIIKPNSDKRLVSGTKKKGSFIPLSALGGTPDTIIITEGYATALTVSQLHEGVILAAIDEGNLLPVAEQVRKRWPESKIILAADNDWHEPGELDSNGKPKKNVGKMAAEKTAKAINGWVSIPPTEHKADWDDYRQRHGIEAAKQAFREGLYQYYAGAELDMYELGSGEVITGEELALLEKMNKTYTHITIGGKHRVVSLKPCQVNGVTHVFEELTQFKNYFLHEGRIAKKMSLGEAWLKWKGKNYKPDGVGFYPDPKRCPDSVYNLFMGLAIDPIEGDCTVYLDHIKHVICAGDERAYQYVVSWLAHLFQKPDEKPSVAIAMKSVPGTGKGTLVRPLLEILGQYGVQVNGAEQITAKFNATMANKLLVFADEATVAKASDGEKLRGIISEPTFNLERKGIDAEAMVNFSRLIFASNSTQALKAGIRERRYLVLEPDGTRAQDKAYFDNLYQWLNDNGVAKLLHYLLNYDISHFDRHRAPQTDALKEEILFGLTGLYAYLYAELAKEEPFRGMARIPVSELIDNYLLWCRENNEEETEPAARRRVGSTMVKMGLDSSGRRGRGVGIVYELPSLNELRVRFAQMIGMGVSDVF